MSPPSPDRAAVVAFPAYVLVAAAVDRPWLDARTKDGDFGTPMSPPFLVALEEHLALSAGNLDTMLMGSPLPGPPPLDLRPVDQHFLDLQRSDLEPVDLRRSDLRPVDLQPSDLEPVDLQRSDLRPVDLQPSDLEPVDLQRSDLKPLDLQPSHLQPLALQSSDLQSSDRQSSDRQSSDLQSSDLQPLAPQPSDLQPSDLQPSDLQPSDLQPSDLQPSDLQPSDLQPLAPEPLAPEPLAPQPVAGLARGPVPDGVASVGLGLAEPAATLRVPARDAIHPRVERALRYRTDVRVWTCEHGILIIGRGLAGRWETAIEVNAGSHNKGYGRALATAARHLVPEGRPVWGQVAPGNASSLRAFLAAGYTPVGSEVILTPFPPEAPIRPA
jgi:hypothetical protein